MSSRLPAIAVSLTILLLTVAGGAAAQQPDTPLDKLPYTPGLDVAAMDRNADPCQDFFRYSCGAWVDNNPIPPDRSSWSVYSKLAKENMRYLWGILERAADTSHPRDANQQKIGDYFAACMDTAAVDARGLAPLKPVFTEIDQLGNRRDLAPLLARLHDGRANGDIFFEYTGLQDFEDATRYIGTFFAGGLGLPERDYYLSKDPKMRDARQHYRQHIATMLTLVGEPAGRAERESRQILAFETRLAEATLPPVDQQDPTKLDHPMSAAALQKAAPGFDWVTYIRLRSPTTLARINFTEPAFARRVGRLVARTPLPELKAYLRWGYLRSHASLLPKPVADESFAFNQGYLNGVKQQPPRWKTCVQDADRDLGEAVGEEFVRNTFSAQTRERAQQMAREIENVMRQRIQQLDWMSDATKQKALEKLAAIRDKIGYPNKWRDYGPLQIRRDDYYGNRSRAAAFEETRLLNRIGKPVDPDDWDMTPQTVNAYYDWQRNDINFPAGVLQPPLFDTTIDAAPSWGNTGGTMGHELIHGFDDSGRHFDAHGNLKDWWTAKDAQRFDQRAQCLVDQYAKYTVVDDIKINSKLTLGEDLADLSGLTLAYIGWKAVTAGQDLKPRDGLTPAQRFFVGYAQWACGHTTDEAARIRARTDPHSPLRYRVNGVVVNMPEFAEAFHCKAGDAMVKKPKDVCRVW